MLSGFRVFSGSYFLEFAMLTNNTVQIGSISVLRFPGGYTEMHADVAEFCISIIQKH